MNVRKVAPQKEPFRPQSVDVTVPVVEDLINAERITGKSSGFEFLAAVVASACIFDEERRPVEDVRRMEMSDFLTLTDECGLNGQAISPDTSSTSSGKGSGESQPS